MVEVYIITYYINFKSQGEETANQRFAMLMSLPVEVLKSIDEPYMVQAGILKASYSISFADALIAAYVYLENASLVHKDPEYLTLEKEIDLVTLPLKKKLARYPIYQKLENLNQNLYQE